MTNAPISPYVAQQKIQQYIRANQFAPAAELLEDLLRQQPGNLSAMTVLSSLYGKMERYDEVLQCCKKALKINPKSVELLSNMGNALHAQGKSEKAIDAFKKALAIQPDALAVLTNIGIALTGMTRFSEAENYLKQSLAQDPNNVLACFNLAVCHSRQGHFSEAAGYYQKVLFLAPDLAEAQWDYACVLLALGDLKAGWKKYQWRWSDRNTLRRDFPFTEWSGQDLNGKTILAYAEQGLGDEIMFASCLDDLVNEGGNVILECDRRLKNLFAGAFPRVQVMGVRSQTDHEWLNGIAKPDYQVAIGSLPGFYRDDFGKFPARPYLSCDEDLKAKWAGRLSGCSGTLKVGIAWRGGKDKEIQRRRMLKLAGWKRLFDLPGITWVNLQYGECAKELASIRGKFNVSVMDWDDFDQFNDIDDLAALISCLDLVVSTDNSTVHLSGALGVETWVLLSTQCEWRWRDSGSQSYWYRAVKTIRQSGSNEWGPVMEQVAEMLGENLKTRSR